VGWETDIFNGALDLVSIAFPAAGPFIGIFQKCEPFLQAGLPILVDAIKEGPAAFSAAKVAAPDLFAHLASLTSMIKSGNAGGAVTDDEVAHVVAHIAGIDPPGWTHEETQAWWDRASAAAASG
jgi:hypothetical protein